MKILSSTIAAASLTAFAAQSAVDFSKDIAPILTEHCLKCHGTEKQKGKYRLDSKDAAFKGGKSDKTAVVAGDPDKSEMIHRVFLAKDNDELMPPEGGPLAEPLRAKLKEWIKEGAKWPDGVVLAAAVAAPAPSSAQPARPARPVPPLPQLPKEFQPASSEAAGITALSKAGVEARPIALGVPWKEANFRLKGPEVTDATLSPVSGINSLVELRLGNTKITDAGLEHIQGLQNLVYLNLYGTKVTDAGLAKLTGLTHLRNLYLWQTQVTPEGVKKLQAALPGVDINTGWVAPPVEKKDEAKKEEPKK